MKNSKYFALFAAAFAFVVGILLDIFMRFVSKCK